MKYSVDVTVTWVSENLVGIKVCEALMTRLGIPDRTDCRPKMLVDGRPVGTVLIEVDSSVKSGMYVGQDTADLYHLCEGTVVTFQL